MLSFCNSSGGAGQSSRRAFLRIGGAGLGALTLPQFLALQASASNAKSPLRDKSVVFLFMHGGPSQFETFDPKMNASASIRSATGEIATSIPGVTFGSTFEKLAQRAHLFNIVRSFVTGDGNHDIKPVMSKDTLKANLGSLYSRVAGPIRTQTAMPTNVALFPRAVDPDAGPPSIALGTSNRQASSEARSLHLFLAQVLDYSKTCNSTCPSID